MAATVVALSAKKLVVAALILRFFLPNMSTEKIIEETSHYVIERVQTPDYRLMIYKGLLSVLSLALILLAGKFSTFYFRFPLIYCIFLQRYEITIRLFYVRIMSF